MYSVSLGFKWLINHSNMRSLLANGINTGGMVDCCESRGAGSREEKIGADTVVC